MNTNSQYNLVIEVQEDLVDNCIKNIINDYRLLNEKCNFIINKIKKRQTQQD